MQVENAPIRDLAWVLGTDAAGLIGRQAAGTQGLIVSAEQLGYREASANLGEVLQSAWNDGLIVHLGAREYLTSSTAYIRSRTGFIGPGSRVTSIRAVDGFDGNVVDTENFDVLAATDAVNHAAGVLQQPILRGVCIDGNRGAFAGPVTASNGFGVRLYGRQMIIDDVRIVRTAGVGLLTQLSPIGLVTEAYHPKDHAKAGVLRDLFIYDSGEENFIFRGPTDIRIDTLYAGWAAGSLGTSYNAGKTSLHYPGETVDSMVFDNAGCEIGMIHAFDNRNGWGVKVRSSVVEIDYSAATAMTGVPPGTTLTGGTSGATGVLVSKWANGWTGTLVVRPVSGTFQAGETISGGGGTATIGTVIARSPRFRCADFMSERNFGQLSIGPQVRYEIAGEVHNNEGGDGSRPMVEDNSLVGGLARIKAVRGGPEMGSTLIELKGAKGLWEVQAQTNTPRAGHGIDLSGTDYILTAMVERASGTTQAGETSSGIIFRAGNARNKVAAKVRDSARSFWYQPGSCAGNILDLQSVDHTGGAGADHFGIGNLGSTERRLASLSTVVAGAITWENAPYAQAVVNFDTVDDLLANSTPYGSNRVAGQRITAGGFDYIIAAAGASDHHLITVGLVKLYVDVTGLEVLPFDAFAPAKNGYAAGMMTPAPDMATIVDDIPKLNLALQLMRGREVRLSPGATYGQNTTLVIPANTKLNGGLFAATIAAKDGFVGWQCETENYDAAYANAQTDPNGDFNDLVPKRPSVVGVIFDGAHQSYNRSFIRRAEATAGGGGIRFYAIQFELNVAIFNQPGVGLSTYSRGGNGPTPLRVNRTKQVQLHVLIDQTAGEGWVHRGPADVVAGVVYQCNAGARLVGQAAGQEDTGKKPSAIYGATNGGYTDGIVFDGAAVEMMFCHSWGNRAGRGIVQYGGRLLAPLIIAENNHFGGVRLEGGTGVIGILKAHKNCAWVEDFIGAPAVFDASANVYHNSGQTGTETNSHIIGQIQIEDNNALGALRGGIAHGLRLGPNSRHLIVSAIHVSKRGVIPGHGILIDAGAAYYDIGGIRVHDAIGDTGGGVMSAAVHRAGGGMGRIRGQSVNCSVGYRNAGPTTNLVLEHVDFLVSANAGQLVFDGLARSNAGQRWDIRGTVDGAYVDLARNGGTLTIATADAAGATVAPTHNRHLITCQADGNYVVTNLTAPAWARPGDRFQFSTVTGARDVTFTPTTGNIRCNAGANRVLDTPADRIEFEFDGANFVEISFANNV